MLLAKQLFVLGLIETSDFETLWRLADHRKRIAHGFEDLDIQLQQLTRRGCCYKSLTDIWESQIIIWSQDCDTLHHMHS